MAVARYRDVVPTWLGFVWTSPNTLIGVLVGLLTFQRPRVAHGLLLFDRVPRGLTTVMLRATTALAMTIGFVVISAGTVEGALLAHERQHVRQYCAWGPLFIPVYLLARDRATATGGTRWSVAAQRAAARSRDRLRTAGSAACRRRRHAAPIHHAGELQVEVVRAGRGRGGRPRR